MKTETLLRGGLAMSLLTCTILMFFFAEGERKLDECKVSTTKQIDSLQTLSDSLRDESFINFTEAGRYEVALEIYKETNPKAVQEIELIKATQTE